MKQKSMIIFPTGQSASQDCDYFEVFTAYMREHDICSSIVLYPKASHKIIEHAVTLTKCASLVPVPIANPYSGTADYPNAIKLAFSSILRNVPEELHVVTSGGTSKIGNLAVLIGNLAEKFGIDADYIWAAKDNKGVYQINKVPKIISEAAEEFDVLTCENGDIKVIYPAKYRNKDKPGGGK